MTKPERDASRAICPPPTISIWQQATEAKDGDAVITAALRNLDDDMRPEHINLIEDLWDNHDLDEFVDIACLRSKKIREGTP